MSNTPNPPALQMFVVVARVRDDATTDDFLAVRDEERKQLEVLHSDGRIGAHHVSGARATTFWEVIATDEEQVVETMEMLPYTRFFELDIFPTKTKV